MSTSPLLIVAGPTGAGKSDLALSLAERYNGEIVNCDSLQLYRYLDIGTAKVPLAERRGIPHHLIDILNPDQVFTAGDYIRLARPLLREIAHRGRFPIICGGTGFYLRALLHGLSPGPVRDDRLRERLLERKERLPRILQRLDPATAARIHPNDLQKTIRAVEACLLSRRPMTDLFSVPGETLTGFSILKICLNPDRNALAERLNQRCVRMFDEGIVEEVRHVLHLGFPTNSKALEAIGYTQALGVIEGRLSIAQAVELTQAATRQYAKRQRTWFRSEPQMHYLIGFGSQDQSIDLASKLITETLNLEKKLL